MAARTLIRATSYRNTGRTLAAALVMGVLSAGSMAVLAACDEPPKDEKPGDKSSQAGKEPKLETVTIAGKEFHLEPAVDDAVRFKGLSDRTEIKADGGMLFAFTKAKELYFVMRDCPIPIDIIFLDATGRVTAFHKMLPEEPRTAEEKVMGIDGVNDKYEARLKHYGSKYAAQFVIELKGNALDDLKVQEGDQVKLDVAGLKKRAK